MTVSEKSQANQDSLVQLQVLRPFLGSLWFRSQLSESGQHLLKIPTVGVGASPSLICQGRGAVLGSKLLWVSGPVPPGGQWGLQSIKGKVRGPVPTLMMPWQVASGSPTRLVPLMDMI